MPVDAERSANLAERVAALDGVDARSANASPLVDDCLNLAEAVAQNVAARRHNAEHSALHIVCELRSGSAVNVVDEVLHLLVTVAELFAALIVNAILAAHDSSREVKRRALRRRLGSLCGRNVGRCRAGRVGELAPRFARHIGDIEIKRRVEAIETAIRRVLVDCAATPSAEAAIGKPRRRLVAGAVVVGVLRNP